jgi:hypothetical protein
MPGSPSLDPNTTHEPGAAMSPFAAAQPSDARYEVQAATYSVPGEDAGGGDDDTWREACLAAQPRRASESDLVLSQQPLVAPCSGGGAAAAAASPAALSPAPTIGVFGVGGVAEQGPTAGPTAGPAAATGVAAADSPKPVFHVMPVSGWGSDPNGPIFYKGRYHL